MHVLVLGVGSIGRRHLGNLLSLDRGVCVVAVDPFSANRNAVVEIGVETCASLEEALCKYAFEAALVCTPNHLHVEQCRILLEAGCHVFVEKPVAVDVSEAMSLEPVLKLSGRGIMVGCNLRFHPGVRAVKKALDAGRIGRPLWSRAWFSHYLPNWRPGQDYRQTYSAQKAQGGGILLDAIHEPDYVSWLFGPVTKVQGQMGTLSDLEIDVEDVASYTMWHGSRMLSQIHVDFVRRDKSRGIEVAGTDGTLVWNSYAKNPENVSVRLFDAETSNWTSLFLNPEYDLNQQYVDELAYFLDCVETGEPFMNDLEGAVGTMRTLDGIRISSTDGKLFEL